MKGRTPTPTRLKVTRGTDRSDRRLSNEFTPEHVDASVKPPIALLGTAKKEWQRVVEQLAAKKILTQVDLSMLAAYCNEIGRYLDLQAELKTEGLIIDGINKSGNPYTAQNPKLSIANQALKQAKEIATHFGFTPAARVRIPQQEGTQTSLFDDFFGT